LSPTTARLLVDEYVPSQQADEAGAAEPVYQPPVRLPARPRVRLPLVLFGLTCAATFFAGGARTPDAPYGSYAITFGWSDGLAYMAAVMAILLAHEMGHFLQAVRYGIPASLPFFIPMPITPLGTMGAVIGMQGTQADRRQLFDIGLTGPLAGLVVAVPLAIYGISIAEPADPPPGSLVLADPLVFRWLIEWLRPDIPPDQVFEWNPYYMAAWFGLFLTGLNMVPVSQLDGGHTSFALFGPRTSRLVARLFVVSVLAMVVQQQQYNWLVMLVLVMFLGIDHPPTRDDTVRLGPVRRIVGYASLSIPIFCLSPVPIMEWR
jgi:membrane-associated protease RseP (regulator of RpoE activity)